MRARTLLPVIAVTAALTSPALAIDCHASKGAGHPWAWRQVDGKRCWYKGKAGIDKKRLRWASTVGHAPRKPIIPVAPPDHPLLQSVWPPAETFDQRFKGVSE